jgi:diguanylate cyclase (GGDEF)-like protein
MVGNIPQKEFLDLSYILKSDLFSNLLPEERLAVTEQTGIIYLRKGACLFSPGEKAEHLYLLHEGCIRISKPLVPPTGQNAADFEEAEEGSPFWGGRDEEIARFTPGDFIGDFDFARGADYDAKAEALDDSTLLMFPGFGLTLDAIALESPNIVSRLLLNSAAMVTGRIKSTRKLVMENMFWVQELYREVYEDPGTGLWKQTFLADEINRLLEDPMALIMLKPDRFKILVDANGHEAGDKAMIKIAAILKDITRRVGRGWALRFKSNETGILVNNCDATLAESLALSLSKAVSAIPPFPLANGQGDFSFSGSIAWGIWPVDNQSWESLFQETYQLLMDTWKAGGKKSVRYRQEQSK